MRNLLFSLLVLISTCSSVKDKPNEQEIIQRAINSSVVIVLEESYLIEPSRISVGSGFLSSNFVITNTHVIHEMIDMDDPEIDIRFLNGDILHPTEVYGSLKYDIALLKIDEAKTYLQLTEDKSHIGQKVFTICNAYPYEFSTLFGYISYIDRTSSRLKDILLLQSNIDLFDGCSGSPLLNTEGQVIGINQSVWGDRQGISLSIPSSYILKILNGEIAVEQYR